MRHAVNPAMIFMICSSKIHPLYLFFRESEHQNLFCLSHFLSCILREGSVPSSPFYWINGRVVVDGAGNSPVEAIVSAAASQTSRWRRERQKAPKDVCK